jgi:hypothetical protein
MDWLTDLFSKPYPSQNKDEVENLLAELIDIGKRDDYLAERHLPGFNSQYRHVRARQIGQRLHAIGGLNLMLYAQRQVKRSVGGKLGRSLSEHLEYAWADIGDWMK